MTQIEPTKALKPWYRVYKQDDTLIFHYADSVISLKGRAAETILPKLLPLLDGRHSIEQIERIVGTNAEVTRAAVNMLERYELLMGGAVPENETALARTAVFLSSIGGTAATETIEARIANATIGVTGSSNAAFELVRALRAAGVGTVQTRSLDDVFESSADLLIAAPTWQEVPQLRAVNTEALKKQQPWMQVLPYDGRFAALGPIFVPYETACYACYQLRRASNVKYTADYVKLENATAQFEQCAPIDSMVAGLAVLHALRWIGAGDPFLAGNMLAVQPLNERATSLNHVLRVPRCTECSPAVASTPPSPWYES